MTADLGLQIFVFSVMHSTDRCNHPTVCWGHRGGKKGKVPGLRGNEFSPLEEDNWGELCVVVVSEVKPPKCERLCLSHRMRV